MLHTTNALNIGSKQSKWHYIREFRFRAARYIIYDRAFFVKSGYHTNFPILFGETAIKERILQKGVDRCAHGAKRRDKREKIIDKIAGKFSF